MEGAASLIYLLRSERGGFLYWKKGGMRAFVLVVRRITVLKEENTVWRDVCRFLYDMGREEANGERDKGRKDEGERRSRR